MDILYDLWLDQVLGLACGKKREINDGMGSREFFKRCSKSGGLTTDLDSAKRLLEDLERKEIVPILSHDERYPSRLDEMTNPPFILYCKGNVELLAEEYSVAIVGARKASLYGKWAARSLAEKMASSGVTVVSGMAYGIDTEAHLGALDAGGKTIAVLGCGVDICYPKRNSELKKILEKRGLVISEFQPGTEPLAYHFPMRNRIVSGLSKGVAVVEAGVKSGSLITAELAAEQGKDVYAVLGNINSPLSLGTNKLLKDGALPVTALSDILEDWKISHLEHENHKEKSLGQDEKMLYDILIKSGETTADELSRLSGMSVAKVNGLVTILEIKGHINTALGKIFIAN